MYVANLCLKQFIQNDLDFPFDYCNRNYHFKGTYFYIQLWDGLFVHCICLLLSSLSCCFYERFFAIDWLFVHLCMHKINLLPCVSMALAKEGSPTIILKKSCGGHFLWKRVWDLGWSGPVGHFWAHKLLELFITINKRDFMLYFFFINFLFFEITTLGLGLQKVGLNTEIYI